MVPHQRFLLAQQLAHSAFREDAVARVSEAIAARLQPYAEAIARLDTIPGVGRRIAETLVAQVGTDMSRFPTAAHLASWAGICPGNHARGQTPERPHPTRQSLAARGPRRGRPCRGAQQADGPGRAVSPLLLRRGKTRAIVAVGHTILVIASQLLKAGTGYQELGAQYFAERHRGPQLLERDTRRPCCEVVPRGVAVRCPASAAPRPRALLRGGLTAAK